MQALFDYFRSSHQRCSVRKGVLTNFTKKRKKRLWHRCFPVNFVKFLRIPFSHNTDWRLFLLFQNWKISRYHISKKKYFHQSINISDGCYTFFQSLTKPIGDVKTMSLTEKVEHVIFLYQPDQRDKKTGYWGKIKCKQRSLTNLFLLSLKIPTKTNRKTTSTLLFSLLPKYRWVFCYNPNNHSRFYF